MKKNLLIILVQCLVLHGWSQLDSIVYGIARSSTGTTLSPSGTIYLAKINPTTGVVTNISPVSQSTTEEMGNVTIDTKKKIFYFFNQQKQMIGLTLANGTMVSSPVAINLNGQYFSQMAYHCPDSTIYGLARGAATPSNPNTGYIYLAKINPVTGSVTNISPNSVGTVYEVPNYAIDTKKKIYYFVKGGNMITGLDLATGTVVTSVVITNTAAQFFSQMVYNRADSTMYGLGRGTTGTVGPGSGYVYLARINPVTGVATNISPSSVGSAFIVYAATIDPYKKVYYYNNGTKIVALDLATGTVVTNPTITNINGQYFDSFCFYLTPCHATKKDTVVNPPPPPPPNGVAETEESPVNRIFPNPASDNLQLELKSGRDCSVDIINFVGACVYSHALTNVDLNIDTSNMANGLYSVVLTENSGSRSVRKIVIDH